MSSHRIFGRQLSRDTEHRTAMRRNLVQSLFEHGKVRTTLPKALEVKAMAERLITLARANTLNSRRRVISILRDRRLTDEEQEFTGKTVVQKLFDEIGPQFADRPGGYTRIIKLSDYRIGDGGSLVLLQLLTEKAAPRGTIRRSAGLRRKRNERRRQFAAKALKQTRDQSRETAPATEKSPAPADTPAAAEPATE
jgi:large subunit ribosomal protein L17